MRDTSAAQGDGNHGEEAVCVCRDRSQPHHQTIEYGLLGIVVAVADADSPGMTPDACRQEQEPEPRSGQSSVAERFHRGIFFFNLSLVQRKALGVGKPKRLQGVLFRGF